VKCSGTYLQKYIAFASNPVDENLFARLVARSVMCLQDQDMEVKVPADELGVRRHFDTK
jgi:hypothetical protein